MRICRCSIKPAARTPQTSTQEGLRERTAVAPARLPRCATAQVTAEYHGSSSGSSSRQQSRGSGLHGPQKYGGVTVKPYNVRCLRGGRDRSSGLSLLNFQNDALQHGFSFSLEARRASAPRGMWRQRCRASTLPIREAGGSPVALECRNIARRAKRDERCPNRFQSSTCSPSLVSAACRPPSAQTHTIRLCNPPCNPRPTHTVWGGDTRTHTPLHHPSHAALGSTPQTRRSATL